jgi:hypothetical protein
MLGLAGLALCLSASGCGGSPNLAVKGRLLKNGEPFRPDKDDIVRITFAPIPEPGQRAMDYYAANFNHDDGTFRAAGKDGTGVPPGKYRIGIEHLRNKRDLLRGAFDADRSPFVREVNGGIKEITIDLAKRE